MNYSKSLSLTFLFAVLLSANLHSQWTLLPTNTTTDFVACKFFNAQTGILSGQDQNRTGKIFRTQDGGLNWSLVLSTSVDEIFECLSFIDGQTGWTGTYYSKIYKTTNGGLNWNLISNVNYGQIRSVFFADSQTGWLQTEFGLRKTTNAGVNWFNPGQSLPGSTLFFFNTTTGFTQSETNYIMRTTNGGSSFDPVYYTTQNYGVYSFDFLNSQTGFACGTRSLTLKTTNAGVNWNFVSVDSANPWLNNFYKISFVDENLGYACGQYIWSGMWGTTWHGILMKTTNGGSNWTSIDVSSSSWAYYDIKIVDGQTGYMVGQKGYVYKTTNGGFVGIHANSTETPSHFSLSQNYPNPFNPSTKIKFNIPRSAFTIIKVYDILGRQIATPVREQLKPGKYEVEFDGSNLPSGVYFYKLVTQPSDLSERSDGYTETKKMILLK